MIPRLKPWLGVGEALALVTASTGSVSAFETAFADRFGAADAVAFPYGRSALWALLKSQGVEGMEIVMPAYTCVVVAHAAVLSGNTCRFVDASLHDYNMDLDQLDEAITARTGAILPTHVFGCPVDVKRFRSIVSTAERRLGRRLLVIHDCAHGFGTRSDGVLVTADGDGALFGLGISKLMTSIFGGMLTTNDPKLAERLRAFRDTHFVKPSFLKGLMRRAYLVAVYPAFSNVLYGMVNWLEEDTRLLDSLSKAYHLDDRIHFPPDHRQGMLDVEAAVGLVQLRKYDDIVRRRVAHARYYDDALASIAAWRLPPRVDGATYSHYSIRVPDRERVTRAFRRSGIQVGDLIQYSVPHMHAYGAADPGRFPNSWLASRSLINLPVHPGLTEGERERIATHAKAIAA